MDTNMNDSIDIHKARIERKLRSKEKKREIVEWRKKNKEQEVIRLEKKKIIEIENEKKQKQRVKDDYDKGLRSKSFYEIYHLKNNTLITNPVEKKDVFDEKFADVEFPELYDSEYWIGVFPDNKRHLDPLLKIFHISFPSRVLQVPIYIWSHIGATDYWFNLKIRPNKIYISDYNGFRIYDFELNLLFKKNIINTDADTDTDDDIDVYGFEIDEYNWNKCWIWSANMANKLLQTESNYYSKVGLEEIYELVII